MFVIFGFFEQSELLHVGDDRAAAFETIEPREFFSSCVGHDAIFADDDGNWELVARADLEIDRIVGRCDFDGPCAEAEFNCVVGDDGDRFVLKRE